MTNNSVVVALTASRALDWASVLMNIDSGGIDVNFARGTLLRRAMTTGAPKRVIEELRARGAR